VPWTTRMGRVAGMFLGVVFLTAAVTKALDPASLQEMVVNEGLDFALPAFLVAPIALILEGGLGLALLFGIRHYRVLVPATLLTLFFVFLTGRAYYHSLTGQLDPNASCGCFGNLVERTPQAAFWQDLALLAPATLLAWFGPERSQPFPRAKFGLAGTCTALLLGLSLVSPDLPLDDLITRLSAGTRVTDLCAGQGADRTCMETHLPEAEHGDHLVLIADLDDDEFAKSVESINAYVQGGAETQVWVLCDATSEQCQEWFWTHAPAFEVRPAPRGLLRPLYRRLPRSFRVRDGTVTETYDGLPPLQSPEEAP
jgi:uncharacterized membrane protein YphA (DoxX/SURF4 family)